MEKKTTDFKIDYAEVPLSWKNCFNENCPMKADCLRYLTGEAIPEDKEFGMAIYPKALKENKCRFFKEIRVIKAAWGFNTLFHEVKSKDETSLRMQVKSYLGSNGTYYKYHNGKRLLTPEQQTWIINLFEQYGYSEGLSFDNYVTLVDYNTDL